MMLTEAVRWSLSQRPLGRLINVATEVGRLGIRGRTIGLFYQVIVVNCVQLVLVGLQEKCEELKMQSSSQRQGTLQKLIKKRCCKFLS
jgi:hypothetical protein